jgi:hypothetical protein
MKFVRWNWLLDKILMTSLSATKMLGERRELNKTCNFPEISNGTGLTKISQICHFLPLFQSLFSS